MNIKVQPSLSLVARLSCGITIITSTIYLIICTFVLVYNNCTESIDTPLLLPLLYRIYILDDECSWSIKLDNFTKPETVFILTVFTLCVSAVLLISAICFIVVIKYKTDLVLIAGYIYVGLSLGSLVVDVTLATHFGLDYSEVVNEIAHEELPVNNKFAVLFQFGILILMAITMKGFAIPLLNIIFIIIIVVYLENFKEIVKRSQHSIHTTGPLNAYQWINHYRSWQTPSNVNSSMLIEYPSTTNSNLNSTRPNESGQSNYRLTSPDPKGNTVYASTPNGAQSSWLRQWPEPDYSPQFRRLKSALKTSTPTC